MPATLGSSDAGRLEVSSLVYSWIKLPITDEAGQVMQARGVVDSQPGLYFVGIPFRSSIRSSLIDGIGGDAKYVVEKIAARRSRA